MNNKYIYFNYNKYKNKSCKCKQDHVHHSIGEARYCDQLLIEKRAGLIKDYETQVKYILTINGIQITTHIVDFVITANSGKKEVREYKGFGTQLWQVKMKLFKALYPEIPYIVVRN